MSSNPSRPPATGKDASTSFISLPQDVQDEVFYELDAEDLLNCRIVCKSFCASIDNGSPMIRYKLKLLRHGMVDNPSFPMKIIDRIASLSALEMWWNRGLSDDVCTTIFDDKIAADVLRNKLWDPKAPSLSDCSYTEGIFQIWGHTEPETPVFFGHEGSFGFDTDERNPWVSDLSDIATILRVDAFHEHDLLVVIQRLQDPLRYIVHLTSVSNGNPHIEAANPSLDWESPILLDGQFDIDIDVLNSLLGVKVFTYLVVWNWRTGEVVKVVDQMVAKFCFLTESFLVTLQIPVVRHHELRYDPGHRVEAKLVVSRMDDTRRPWDWLTLTYPSMHFIMLHGRSACSLQTSYPTASRHRPFHASFKKRILAVTFRTDPDTFIHVFRADTLVSLANGGAHGPLHIYWDAIEPSLSRVIDVPAADVLVAVHGQKLAYTILDEHEYDNPRAVENAVLDFNQFTIRDHPIPSNLPMSELQENAEQQLDDLIGVEIDKGFNVVTAPTVVQDSEDPHSSGLLRSLWRTADRRSGCWTTEQPYRRRVIKHALRRQVDEVYMAEDLIVWTGLAEGPVWIKANVVEEQDIQDEVLCDLDVEDLVECRLVCKSLRDSVDNGPPLLKYKRRLHEYGMVDNPSFKISVYDDEEFASQLQHKGPLGRELMANGDLSYTDGVFCIWNPMVPAFFGHMGAYGVVTKRRKPWVLNLMHIAPVLDMAMVPMANLCVALQREEAPVKYTIHLLRSTDGKPHPDATKPTLKWEWGHSESDSISDIHILDHLLGVRTNGVVAVWNWKTGELVKVVERAVVSFCFLNCEFLVTLQVPNAPPRGSRTVEPKLVVSPLGNTEHPHDWMTIIYPPLDFELLIDQGECTLHTSYPAPSRFRPFHAKFDKRILAATFRFLDKSFIHVIHADVLLDLASWGEERPMQLYWDVLRSSLCRCIELQTPDPLVAVHGQKLVYTIVDHDTTEAEKTVILDFNQLMVCANYDRAFDQTRAHCPPPIAALLRGKGFHTVREPTIIRDDEDGSSVWHTKGVRLGEWKTDMWYREHIMDGAPGGRVNEVSITEDVIVWAGEDGPLWICPDFM
ncbi:hypothetical protein EIP91_002496 [Steccherinum ochraceum]|uniref:F-box domain-containing protein n=1 Tax=Steccherinum ochraceum TaxID=92696 RepID=A0A4R0RIF6_9APHY|nr:hypothetical protein EIP91_002496 [Steccherinum ochraceum]